jgi:hypothetical protein
MGDTVAPGPLDDDELVLASKDLALKAIRKARWMLDYGSPQMQLSVIRALVGTISRAATGDRTEAEELSAVRTELQNLNRRLLSAVS